MVIGGYIEAVTAGEGQTYKSSLATLNNLPSPSFTTTIAEQASWRTNVTTTIAGQTS